MSGIKGSQQGARFVVEDPRTVFYIPEDKQVTIYFEWDGPIGTHRCEGLWKNPDGKIAVISEFTYEAKQKRFGGYWTLVLSETTPVGIWTLEARIDGEAAGTHTFQILSTPRPERERTPPPRKPLSAAEIYKKSVAALVTIQALDEAGKKFSEGSGFILEHGVIVTSFQAY